MRKPMLNISGQNGNVFSILGSASKKLKYFRMDTKAEEMTNRVYNSESYHEALLIIGEYVDFVFKRTERGLI